MDLECAIAVVAQPSLGMDKIRSSAIISNVRLSNTGLAGRAHAASMDFQGQFFRVSSELARVEGLREAFGAFLHNARVPAEEAARWRLVFTEALVNAIVHGNAQKPDQLIEVSWAVGDGVVRLEVVDGGPGPPVESLAPRLPDDPLQAGGRGLFLIQQSCDRVEHWRGPKGFRLVMVRATPGVHVPAAGNQELLDLALAEISQCYENLAAFYRLGDALIGAEALSAFFVRTAADIAKVVPHDRLALHFDERLHPTLLADLAKLPFAGGPVPPDGVVERALQSGQEQVWEDAAEIHGDPVWGGYACGVSVPLRVSGVTWGALTLARRRRPYLVAAELSTARTYADLFAIAVVNAHNASVRTREQQDLRDLEIASAMQTDLLPLPTLPVGRDWRAVVRRRSARSVAGDYVDVLATPNGGLLLAMVDVMGKGISAALFAGMVRTALHIHVEVGQPLSRLVHNLNRVLCRQIGDLTLFATCALVEISPARDRAFIVNAGHCPVLWLGPGPQGSVREYAPSGPPLGLYPTTEYVVEEQPLAPGDRLLLVTDGLYEWDSAGDEAGNWTRLVQLVSRRHHAGGEALWESFQQRIHDAMPGEVEARDDQTMLFWERCS